MGERYISKKESRRCRQVAKAFKEYCKQSKILIVDAGKLGYVKLQYFKVGEGFDCMFYFTDAKSLFKDLWTDYKNDVLLDYAKDTPMADMSYKEIYDCMPPEMQEKLKVKKRKFKKAARL